MPSQKPVVEQRPELAIKVLVAAVYVELATEDATPVGRHVAMVVAAEPDKWLGQKVDGLAARYQLDGEVVVFAERN